MDGFWSDADVIHRYTRLQAIADGLIVPTLDIVADEDMAAQAGFVFPVGLTARLAAIVRPTDREIAECYQDVKGRLWDVLMMARTYRGRNREEWPFPCIFWLAGREEYGRKWQRTLHLRCVIAANDDGSPTVLIGVADEDLS